MQLAGQHPALVRAAVSLQLIAVIQQSAAAAQQ